jgi:biliverdin reductase
MTNFNYDIGNLPLKVGIVGTGYAAQRRAEAFQASNLTELIAVAGNTEMNTQNFAQTYQIQAVKTWQDLIKDDLLDLICISNVNREHGLIVRQALLANKHLIVEYPLTLNPHEAQELVNLAQEKRKLLHIEHIEILGGVHQALTQNLPQIGNPLLARYSTILAKPKVAPHWTYNYYDYGFPLIAALSRLNRFTYLFGAVDTVNCQGRFWDASENGYFSACWCQAQVSFKNQLMVNLTYGKGDKFKSSERTLEIYGDEGTLKFEGETGMLIRGNEIIPLEVASRRGLFNRDTDLVLAHLCYGENIYIKNTESIYALKVAGMALQSYQQGVDRIHQFIN